jgi:hypothetical protein
MAALFAAAGPVLPPGPGWPGRTLAAVSVHAGVQTVLTAALPAGVIGLAGLLGATLREVGAVSLAMQCYLVFTVLALHATPVLYDRLARHAPAEAGWRLRRKLGRVGGPAAWAAAAALALALPWPAARAWPALAGHEPGIMLMTLAGLVALPLRAGWTLLLSRGQMAALSRQAGLRLAVGLALVAAGMVFAPATVVVPSALLAAELAALAALWRTRRTRRAAPADYTDPSSP